jgi:poly-gamma-glutamate synthesis protein (capsule biosynthesis protein)
LAVPFATEWETVTLSEAQRIIAEGHPLAVALPWNRLIPSLRALRVDGWLPVAEDYPLVRQWSLLASPQLDHLAVDLASVLGDKIAAPPPAHLTAVGDIMLDRSLGSAVQRGDLAYPFADIAARLRTADITIGNVESALGDAGTPANKRYTFRAPPDAAHSLALAGFDLVSLANNHAMDYGPEALLQAIELLAAQGIAAIGAGNNELEARAMYLAQIGDLSVGFLAYVNVPVEVGGFDTQSWEAQGDEPGLAWGTPERLTRDVSSARADADLVVVILHSGLEYVDAPSDPQVGLARAAIDAGASLVVGHHTHLLQGVEFYGDGVIVYGLGNFAFQIEGDPDSAILDVWLDSSGVRQLSFTPVVIQFGGRPRLAEPWEAERIRRHIYRQTALLNAR